MTETTRPVVSVGEPTLYVAFELGATSWTLAMTAALGMGPWVCTVPAGAWPQVVTRLAEGRRRCRLGPTARVVSCYEAGRDGFWIHRGRLVAAEQSTKEPGRREPLAGMRLTEASTLIREAARVRASGSATER